MTQAPRLVYSSIVDSPQAIVVSATDSDPAVLGVERRAMHMRYSHELSKAIEDLYFSGQSFHAISKQPGMPAYSTLLKWYAQNAEFRSRIDEADIARAIHHRDQALERATDPMLGKDEVSAARLAFDAHVWAAEKANPNKFGKQINQSTQISGGVVINVNTNVPPRDISNVIELNPDGTVKRIADGDTGSGNKVSGCDNGVCAEELSSGAAPEAAQV